MRRRRQPGTEPEQLQHDYYTRTAESYHDRHVQTNDPHFTALHYISGFVTVEGYGSVLDVGSGTGRALGYLLKRHDGLLVRGVEPVPALIEEAVEREGLSRDWIVSGRGERLPFDDDSFDAVCELGMLHHVARPNDVVTEMLRVARRAVFLSDSNRFGQGSLPTRLAKLGLFGLRLWPASNYLKTRGKGYSVSEGDGLAYSYSVYDSFTLVSESARRVIAVATSDGAHPGWLHPLLTSQHVLLCAFK